MIFFSNFRIRVRIIGGKQKNIQRITRLGLCVNIDQSAICYISIDSSQRAQQTNEKFFSNFGIIIF